MLLFVSIPNNASPYDSYSIAHLKPDSICLGTRLRIYACRRTNARIADRKISQDQNANPDMAVTFDSKSDSALISSFQRDLDLDAEINHGAGIPEQDTIDEERKLDGSKPGRQRLIDTFKYQNSRIHDAHLHEYIEASSVSVLLLKEVDQEHTEDHAKNLRSCGAIL